MVHIPPRLVSLRQAEQAQYGQLSHRRIRPGVTQLFDLATVTQPFTSASFEFSSGSPNSGDATETLALFDYTGSISALTGNTGGAAGFADLGSGTSFGNVSVTLASPGQYTITLNAAGLAALNAALGGQFAFGGRSRR